MTDDVEPIARWDITKLDIKPGNIVILRYRPPAGVTNQQLQTVLDLSRTVLRRALDTVGTTHEQVPVICMTSDWDIAILNPLDLMDVCATAAKAGDR